MAARKFIFKITTKVQLPKKPNFQFSKPDLTIYKDFFYTIYTVRTMKKAAKYSNRIGCQRYKMIISIKVVDLVINKMIISNGTVYLY